MCIKINAQTVPSIVLSLVLVLLWHGEPTYGKNREVRNGQDVLATIEQLSNELLKLYSVRPPVPSGFRWDWKSKAYHPPLPSMLDKFDQLNARSLEILGLMNELHTLDDQNQLPECDLATKLTFCRKATVSYTGKGFIDRNDARIEYRLASTSPAILLIDFTIGVCTMEIIGHGFSLVTENPLRTYPSTRVEFKGSFVWLGENIGVTQFACKGGAHVTIGGLHPHTMTVGVPNVLFYSDKGFIEGGGVRTLDHHWSPVNVTTHELTKAFEKGRLVVQRKSKTKTTSGTVTIDFAPFDPGLQSVGESVSNGICQWGGRTTHGGFVLAAGKTVFSDGKPVVREGDPVLCPIHGMTTVSRNVSSGVYIGGKTVAFGGSRADCGATLQSKNTRTVVHSIKPY